MGFSKTLVVQVGRKLTSKPKSEILAEIEKAFHLFDVRAVQVGFEIIRVSFKTPADCKQAKLLEVVSLFGSSFRIQGGGPPVTMVHVFDFPFEEGNSAITKVFSDFGEVVQIKDQTYLDSHVYTGTRLVSIKLDGIPPRSITISGYLCRIWYKGQPLVCNLCGVQGHKSAVCPNKDKCRRCGQSGHFARNCQNAWAKKNASNPAQPQPQSVGVDGENPPQVSVDDPPSSADLAAVADDALASLSSEAGNADPLPFDSQVGFPLGDSLSLTAVSSVAGTPVPVVPSVLSSSVSQEAGVVTSEAGAPPPVGSPSLNIASDEFGSSSAVCTDEVVVGDSAHVVDNVSEGGSLQDPPPPSPSPEEEYLFTCGQQVPSQESSQSSPPEQSPSILKVSTDVDSMDDSQESGSHEPTPVLCTQLPSEYGTRTFRGKAKSSSPLSVSRAGRHAMPPVAPDKPAPWRR